MTYSHLVSKRKNFKVDYPGFINQCAIENGIYDTGEFLEPWGQWHNSIPADILVIGQDWGGMDYYVNNKGKDTAQNTTCSNLSMLFKELGIEIGNPESPQTGLKIHFTNLIPFIRTGKMQGNKGNIINSRIITECAEEFLKPLIEIVSPKIIIALGTVPFRGLLHALNISKKGSFSKAVESGAISTTSNITIFPMFHCGTLSINMNRKLEQQKSDWAKVLQFMNQQSF